MRLHERAQQLAGVVTESKPSLKKISPGYFKGTVVIPVDGKDTKMEITIGKAQRGAWYYQLDGEDAEDWYPTKRDTLVAVQELIDKGMTMDPRWGLVPVR